MPDLLDRLYCSEQIHIPPTFPFIMKLYCKAAIRTQPYDLLRWSAAYFRALANGEEPPVKERIEYPPFDSVSGLTPGYLKLLIRQIGKDLNTTITAQKLFTKWNCICLEDEALVRLIALMGCQTNINWLKFVAVAAGSISTSLTNTMILICELLTDEPEGGMATIPLDVFNELYIYLAIMECGPLTSDEKDQMKEMDFEDDASVIAEKIRNAIYEGEDAGEREDEKRLTFEEKEFDDADKMEMAGELELVPEDQESSFSEKGKIETEEVIFPDGRTGSHLVKEKEDDDEQMDKDGERGEGGSSEEGSTKAEPSKASKPVEDGAGSEPADEEVASSVSADRFKEETSVEMEEILKPEGKDEEERSEEKAEEEETKPARKIKLEDIEESIRRKIEEGLKEDDASRTSEDGFDTLTSYLLRTAEKQKTFTSEEIGFRIFKKYLRQDVPGIGPKIETQQIEKVIDYMDFNAHKQHGMVMPRNIRHWTCPPLDRVPITDP